jgi:anaerobic dimethyl sulfoxide reductase subunit B (iron-sulfur subunit)
MDLIDDGEDPVCVISCPMRCLEYGELADLKAKHGDKATVPPITDDLSTGPSIVFTPSRLNPDGTLPGAIMNADEEIVSEGI